MQADSNTPATDPKTQPESNIERQLTREARALASDPQALSRCTTERLTRIRAACESLKERGAHVRAIVTELRQRPST